MAQRLKDILDKTFEELKEWDEKRDEIDSKIAEYLISKGLINSTRVECKNLLKLFEGKSVSYIMDPHYIWTLKGGRIYGKLKLRSKIPRIIRPAYDFLKFQLSNKI